MTARARVRGWGVVAACLLVSVASACLAPDEREGPAFTEVDSAGVRITTADAPARSADRAWRLADTPLLEIGVADGEEPYLLSQVVGVTRRSDGSVVVCTRRDRTIRFFGADGVFAAQAAGRGEGPSELRLLLRCLQHDGEIWAYQGPFQPLKIFDADGTLLRAMAMPRPGGRAAVLGGIFADGSLLLRQDGRRRDAPMGLSELSTTLYRFGPDTTLTALGVLPSLRIVRGSTLPYAQAFGPTLQLLTDGMEIVSIWPAGAEVRRSDATGVILRRSRFGREAVPVTQGHVAVYEDQILNSPINGAADQPANAEEARRAIIAMMEYPEALPAHYRMLKDATGNLWLEVGDSPRNPMTWLNLPHPSETTWDVVKPDGEWVTTVTMPERFDPFEIGENYVVGVHKDDLEVERVRVYALDKR